MVWLNDRDVQEKHIWHENWKAEVQQATLMFNTEEYTSAHEWIFKVLDTSVHDL